MVDGGLDELLARGTQGVAERDGSPVGVELLVGVVRVLVHPGQGDAGEGLVDLDRVHLVKRHAGLVQHLAGGWDGSGEHDLWVHAGHGGLHDTRPRLDVELGGHGLGADERDACAVGELAGRARRDLAVLLAEDRGELAELLEVGVPAGALVVLDGLAVLVPGFAGDRDDLAGQEAAVLGCDGPVVGLQAVGVELLAREAPLVRDALGALTLVEHVPVLQELRREVAPVGVAADGHGAHVLDTAREHQVLLTRHHTHGAEVEGLLAAAAHAVERHPASVQRELGGEPGQASDVRALLSDLGDAAHHEVLDEALVDVQVV